MATEAQRKATAKYNKENYDRMELIVPKGKRESIDNYAKSKDMTRNSYINKLIEQDMKIDPSTLDEPILKMIYNHPELIDIMKIISSLPLSAQKEIAENLRHQAELLKEENK